MRNILYIGNKLEKHGFTPTSADSLPGKLKTENIDFRVFSDKKNIILRFIEMVYAIFRYRKWSDLILIDTYSTKNFWYAVCCGWLAKRLKLPYIFILHGGNLPGRLSNSSENVLNVFRKANCNVAPSFYIQQQLNQFKFQNMRVIPNSVILDYYPFKIRKEAKPKLLWLRAFDETYNPQMAVSVFEELIRTFPESELIMVGPDKDGSFQKIKNYILEKKLNIRLTGKLRRKEWIELSNSLSLFINTSRIDNLPVSVLEAMALGMPVISTNVGGMSFLIEDRANGLLVGDEDAKAMLEKITELIHDQELCSTLSIKGRKTVEESFSWEKVKKLWVALLH